MREVELLRRAAALMRERAQAATPGPWGVGNDTNVVRGVEVTGPGSYTCIQSVAEVDDYRCDWDRDEAVEISPECDAEHIASWDPDVALAAADLVWRLAQCWDALPQYVQFAALAKARAYLGEASDA